MLSIQRTKELLDDHKISDEEAEKIRDNIRALGEVMFEQWQYERRKNTANKGPS